MTYNHDRILQNMLRRELEQSIQNAQHAQPSSNQEILGNKLLAELDLAESQGFKDRPVEETLGQAINPEATPKSDLSQEHQRQGLILAKLFAARLNMSQEEYIATLPNFPERIATYDVLGLTVPIIVETRIPWMEAVALSGISTLERLKEIAPQRSRVIDWKDDKFKMPKVPFSAYVQDGKKFVYTSEYVLIAGGPSYTGLPYASAVRHELVYTFENQAYRAGRILDSIALWNVRPDMVRSMHWDVIGTEVWDGLGSKHDSWYGSRYVPCLSYWNDGRVVLHRNPVNETSSDLDIRALVLGRAIRTFKKMN